MARASADDFFLAHAWAGARTLRLADGPDEVHREAVAKMELQKYEAGWANEAAGKVAVVTGGASGIGRALCRRFAAEGARGVVVADVDAAGAAQVAREIGGLAVRTDVSREADIVRLVERAMAAFGAIDLFCSNAGIAMEGGVETSDADWQRIWGINFMAHVYAARAVLPGMLARGRGYLLQTASAAGLLTQIGSAPYAVTKHAAVSLAEWLAVTYGDRGIRVSCLCPQGVRTNMLAEAETRDGTLSAGRRARTRAGRRGRHRGPGRGTLPDPAAPGGRPNICAARRTITIAGCGGCAGCR